MKFCQPHWDELRAGIDERGLSQLIARDGKAAAERMTAEVKGTATDATFDPLMAAHWAIVNRAMERGWRGPFDPAVLCPLCFVQDHYDTCQQPNCVKSLPSEWITGCADWILATCREKGLVAVS